MFSLFTIASTLLNCKEMRNILIKVLVITALFSVAISEGRKDVAETETPIARFIKRSIVGHGHRHVHYEHQTSSRGHGQGHSRGHPPPQGWGWKEPGKSLGCVDCPGWGWAPPPPPPSHEGHGWGWGWGHSKPIRCHGWGWVTVHASPESPKHQHGSGHSPSHEHEPPSYR